MSADAAGAPPDFVKGARIYTQRESFRVAAKNHMLIQGLFGELPPVGAEWSDEEREEWIAAVRAALRLLYSNRGDGTRATLPARALAGEQP
jgi:hypothetical protein